MQNTKYLNKEELNLIELAKIHSKKTYKEGLTSIASIIYTKSGKSYTGINLKYKKIWKCVCAERVALAKAIEKGENDLLFLVSVKYDPENGTYTIMNMCGECRQIAIFYPRLKVVIDDNGSIRSVPIAKLLPFAYQ